MKQVVGLDTIISKVAALGVPGLILVVAITATGLTGAAAITAALAMLGPAGMIGGIATLGVAGLISEGIARYGVEAIFKGVIRKLYFQGETKASIKAKVEKYPITKSLKSKLYEMLDQVQG